MPRKPKRPCRYPCCPNLTDGIYCEEHAGVMERHYEKFQRGYSTGKRYGRAWTRIRHRYANKHPLCEMCMTFGDFIALYVKDMEHRLKPSTVASKKWLIDLKVTPFFKKIPLNEIKPTHVRQWQNSLTSYRDENGKPYAQTYLKCINNQLTAIFNYAVKYYGLKENPCHKAGSIGKKKADEMLFWTKDEFQTFIESMKDRPASYTVFMTMYYTGIREGELLALTPSDIDFEKKTLTVNKSYQRLGREDIITTPKTPKSIRTIPIPDGLCTCLQEYMSHCYGLQKDDRLFPYTKSFLYHEMEYGCKASGVKRIRVHDIRHSHASLLVEMGFSPLLIAERLGHEKVQTTMDTYSHLYPNKQVEVARQLDGIMP